MKKTLILSLAVLLIFGCFSGCTKQQRVRNFGGEETIALPAGTKLVNATWKEDDLWVLTRTMRADEKPENYLFQESSSFGVFEGTLTFVETR
ncbi:MAG: hypothetical protein WCT08_02485 [Patescibacteria group bacterium]